MFLGNYYTLVTKYLKINIFFGFWKRSISKCEKIEYKFIG